MTAEETTTVKKIDFKKCLKEVEDLRLLPPVTIEIPLLAAMEIVGYIQLATKNPAVGNSEFGKMAIDVAQQLQNSLDPNSECFKLLHFGWELQSELREIDSCEQHLTDAKVQELKEKVLGIFGEQNIDTDNSLLSRHLKAGELKEPENPSGVIFQPEEFTPEGFSDD